MTEDLIIERLSNALVRAIELYLWACYYTGSEDGGTWTHLAMSDAEWLAGELGLGAGRHDAAVVKSMIPPVARDMAARIRKGEYVLP